MGGSLGGGSGSAPQETSYGTQMAQALNAQMGIQTPLLAAQQQYLPQYQSMMQTGMTGQLGVTNNLYNTAIGQSAALQQQQFNANAGLYSQIGANSANAYNSMLGAGGANLMASQTDAANQALAQGSNLSPQANQAAQQSARAAMAARGMQYGNQGIAQEVFNNYSLGQQQLATNRAYAANVAGQNMQQANSAYSSFGQPQVANMQNLNANSILGTSYNMYQNPTAGMIFNPESQYNAQINSANVNSQAQYQVAQAQAQAGLTSGIIQGVGTIAGSFLGNPELGAILGKATSKATTGK